MDFVELTDGAVPSKSVCSDRNSAASFLAVPVPWALMYPMSPASVPALTMARCSAAICPSPCGCGAVMWKASELTPQPATSQ